MIRASVSFLLVLMMLALTACTAVPPATNDTAESETGESAAAESDASGEASPAAGRDTFVFVRPLEIVSLDPATITESQSGLIVRNIYSRLVDITSTAQA